MMKYLKLILPALILVFGLMACEEFDKPGNNIIGNGGPPTLASIGFDLNKLAEHAVIAGYSAGYMDSLYNLLEDIPDSAVVYGCGPLFANSPESLCYWIDIDELEIQKYYQVNTEVPIRLQVDNRPLTEGITIRDVLLTYTFYEGAEPYGAMWTKFRMDLVSEDSIQVVTYGDNLDQMVSVLVYYDGWANWLPVGPQYPANGPLASQYWPARIQSNLTSCLPNTTSHMYWDPMINSWKMWFRALPSASPDQFYTVITVSGQPDPSNPPFLYPYVRLFGVNLNDGELWHVSDEYSSPNFPVFTWGLNGENLIQGENTVLGWTGGP